MKNVQNRSDMTPRQQTSVVSKFKVAALSAAITSLLCVSLPSTYASDIEIYKVPEDSVGTTTLMMMLDTSGSMGAGSNSYNEDRIGALKKGLNDALNGTSTTPRIEDKVIIGLATFSATKGYIRIPAKALGTVTGSVQDGNYIKPRWTRYTVRTVVSGKNVDTIYYNECKTWNPDNYNCLSWGGDSTKLPTGFSTASPYITDKNISCTYGNRSDCTYVWENIPKYKNVTHRDDLVTVINSLSASGSTPTAYAYADAAAYLLGTTTALPQVTVNVPVYARFNGNPSTGWACQSWNTNTKACSNWGNYISSGYSVPAGFTSSRACNVGNNSATCFNYNMTLDDTDNNNSGFSSSISTSKDGAIYDMPSSIKSQIDNSAKKECSGQGIYFLTDGEPNPSGGIGTGTDGVSGTAYRLMKQSLSTKGDLFNCNNSSLGNRTNIYSSLLGRTGYFNSSNNGWSCIGKYAQSLLDPAKNPVGLQIKTVVVGFGSDFTSTGNNDVEDAKVWGTLGDGGWVAGSNSQDVVNSINAFIKQLNKDIPSMSTGSSTIPLDELNPSIVQPYAYFPQFEPKVKPEDVQQIWFGNLKKYYVLNNGVYSSKSVADDNTVVVKKSVLQDLADIWESKSSYPDGTALFKKGGVLNRLTLGRNAQGETGRKLLTDYNYDGTKAANNGQISQNLNLSQITYKYTSDDKTKTDTKYAPALMGLLGYIISDGTNTNGLDLSTQSASLRQMGSVYHSKPLLITQSGKAIASKDATTGKVSIDTTNREDYVLFGTTQGLVEIVDASTGIEKFAFVPKEIIEKQSETFKQGGGNLAAGKNALYYGMDGEWVSHTVYVSKSDGTLTVAGASRTVSGGSKTEDLIGKQWVYGGMRMGGRSYYALDLTNIDSPKIKFQIDPSTSKVYSQNHPEGVTYNALAKMGQSWSKPTLGYVNWNGKRKLVMIVGGGYDAGGDDGDGLKSNGIRTGYAGYEIYNYKQETNLNADGTEKRIGAGIYMFDADTGDLLWNADSTNNPSLKYSVASQIRSVDRNNDGIIDHIYFGDLAGQAFRIDFKNDGKDTFKTQTIKILDLHDNNGTSPRFYTLPAFTAHNSAASTSIFGGNTVVVTFVSGNQSSPILATSDSPQKKDPTNLQFDGAYGIFDYDSYPSTDAGRFPSTNLDARTKADENATTPVNTKLRFINGATTATAIDKTAGWGGWYYLFNKKIDGTTAAGASVIKGLTTPIALQGSLYVTQFDASNNGTTSSCGAGVKGHTFTQRICLPGGVCKDGEKYVYNLGSGIVTLNVGSADEDPNKRVIVVPDPNDTCPAGQTCTPANKPKFIATGGALKFIPNRWYERYAQ